MTYVKFCLKVWKTQNFKTFEFWCRPITRLPTTKRS